MSQIILTTQPTTTNRRPVTRRVAAAGARHTLRGARTGLVWCWRWRPVVAPSAAVVVGLVALRTAPEVTRTVAAAVALVCWVGLFAPQGILEPVRKLAPWVGVFATYLANAPLLGSAAPWTGVGLVAITTTATPATRAGQAARHRHRVHLAGREWVANATAAGITAPPVLVDVRTTPTGRDLVLRCTPGVAAGVLEKVTARLASAYSVGSAELVTDPTNAGRAVLRLVEADPLANPPGTTPLITQTVAPDPLKGAPIGVTPRGTPAVVPLVGSHTLVGGITGTGKSNVLHSLIAPWGLADPEVFRLVLIDCKGGVELADWAHRAHRFATTQTEAVGVLADVVTAMETTYGNLRSLGRRKLTPSRETPATMVVVDELAALLGGPDKRVNDRCASLLADLANRGRAAGVSLVAATQRPSHQTVPTWLREAIPTRIGLGQPDATSSDMVLGAGWASRGVDTSRTRTPGRGWVVTDTGTATEVRCYRVSDRALGTLTSRAPTVTSTDTTPVTPGDMTAADRDMAPSDLGMVTPNPDTDTTCRGVTHHPGWSRFTGSEPAVWEALNRLEPAGPTAIANAAGVTPRTVHRALGALHAAGLVVRTGSTWRTTPNPLVALDAIAEPVGVSS